MKRLCILIALMTALSVPSLVAQTGYYGGRDYTRTGSFRAAPGFLDALFHSSRFSMSQSYTMSMGTFGGHGFNQGVYLNTMNFQLSQPLFMQVSVGYAHQPFTLAGSNPDKGQVFLHRAMLQYKPSAKTEITLEYQQIPARLYSPYYYRY
ncbi:hypothetical protein JXO52_13105 [bacterium]|nr:hypothetical protein [bacterium]